MSSVYHGNRRELVEPRHPGERRRCDLWVLGPAGNQREYLLVLDPGQRHEPNRRQNREPGHRREVAFVAERLESGLTHRRLIGVDGHVPEHRARFLAHAVVVITRSHNQRVDIAQPPDGGPSHAGIGVV